MEVLMFDQFPDVLGVDKMDPMTFATNGNALAIENMIRQARQDQVQIYEELNQDVDRRFTTSFIHRVYPIKDNRLLPKGWRDSSFFHSQGELVAQFMETTDPDGVGNDPDYAGVKPPDVFKGQDELIYSIHLPKGIDLSNLSVKVTMHYQSIPPYFLNQRFALAPDGAATQRLFYLTSHLNLEGTAMKDWKLPLVSKQLGYCEDNAAWEEILPAEEEVCN